MGFEIPIDSAYPRHRKTVDLKVRLKDEKADVYPLRMFFWAAENARDGRIRVNSRSLEAALGWSGAPGMLFRCLKASGFIERDGVTIHDWMGGVGRALLAYEVKKFNLRKSYAEKHGIPFAELPPGSGSLEEDFPQSAPNPIQSNSIQFKSNTPPNGDGSLPAEKPTRRRRGSKPSLDELERRVTSGGDPK